MNQQEIIVFFLQIATMLFVGLAFRQLMRVFRLALVVGELIGGILLGPTLLGALAPGVHAWLFPLQGASYAAREALIGLGLLFFMFVAGLEMNIKQLRRLGARVAWTGLAGVFFPFTLGFASVLWFPSIWRTHEPVSSTSFLALFIGTSLSISALPVIARILMDLNLMKDELGTMVMAAGMVDDLIGWALFAILLSRFDPAGVAHGNAVITVIALVLMFVLALTAGRWVAQRMLRWLKSRPGWPTGFLGVTTIVVLLAGIFAQLLGIHAVFGAFIVGIALAQSEEKRHEAHEMVHQFVIGFFAPIYFVSIGLQVNFVANFDLNLVAFVLGVACIGKVAGVTIGGCIGGMPIWQSLAVGFGMNARGAMGIILASVALDYKLIDARIFVALIVMSLVTTLISGPMMQKLLCSQRLQEGSTTVVTKEARLRSVG